MDGYILSIDQGTTSSRAIIFDYEGNILKVAQKDIRQYYPADGLVEHDPENIWGTVYDVCREVLKEYPEPDAAGITNQRETAVVWDRKTGEPVYPAIVWQDRRTAELCRSMRKEGSEVTVTSRSGLLLDPYFSGSKVKWILDNVEGARERAERGELAFGTVDSFLIWRLTGGSVHATDATNASRTLLYNIHKGDWDDELLTLFDIPRSLLPEVKDSSDDFGRTAKKLFGREIPIYSAVGDQHAAMVGQACFDPGMMKCTYGTGGFLVLNTGDTAVKSRNRLLTTIAYSINGEVTYAMEGAIFVAGAAVKWLRDTLGIIESSEEADLLARSIKSSGGVYMVPAFTGLGAPHWDPAAKGAFFGLRLDTGPAEISRAVLESVCYQTSDLLDSMAADGADTPRKLRVDGGMAASGWMLSFLSDITGLDVQKPAVIETTALGAAFLAGLRTGAYSSLDDIKKLWSYEREFNPALDDKTRNRLVSGWEKAVSMTRGFSA
ncbi:glycerol kinase GlpK [Limisalsivibrio acetivorans]|uniref:glycerol kinase GlpK n=1 Tax=Limisalsivibrio acetivorans TaxID=1304888 RepID=UPI0003B3212D|nr:glycerol kinase GlpK [Limisalsivibrio acetivorans]